MSVTAKYGEIDYTAHDLCRKEKAGKISFAIAFHLAFACMKYDREQALKYLNTYTGICYDRYGKLNTEALLRNDFYGDKGYQSIYDYSPLPSKISYGNIFAQVDDLLESSWFSYLLEKINCELDAVTLRWQKIKRKDRNAGANQLDSKPEKKAPSPAKKEIPKSEKKTSSPEANETPKPEKGISKFDKTFLEFKYGEADKIAHELYEECMMNSGDAGAFAFHFLCSVAGLDRDGASEKLNTFTPLCLLPGELYKYYSGAAFDGVYEKGLLKPFLSKTKCLKGFESMMKSPWASYVRWMLKIPDDALEVKWHWLKDRNNLPDLKLLSSDESELQVEKIPVAETKPAKDQDTAESTRMSEIASRLNMKKEASKKVVVESEEAFVGEDLLHNALEEHGALLIACVVHVCYAAVGKSKEDCQKDLSKYRLTGNEKIIKNASTQLIRYSGFYKDGGIFVGFLDPEFLKEVEEFISSEYIAGVTGKLVLFPGRLKFWWKSLLEKNRINLGNDAGKPAEIEGVPEKPTTVQPALNINENKPASEFRTDKPSGNLRVDDGAFAKEAQADEVKAFEGDLLEKAMGEYGALAIACVVHVCYAAAGRTKKDCIEDLKANAITKNRKIIHSACLQPGRYSGFYKTGSIFHKFLDSDFLNDVKTLMNSEYVASVTDGLVVFPGKLRYWWMTLMEKNSIDLVTSRKIKSPKQKKEDESLKEKLVLPSNWSESEAKPHVAAQYKEDKIKVEKDPIAEVVEAVKLRTSSLSKEVKALKVIPVQPRRRQVRSTRRKNRFKHVKGASVGIDFSNHKLCLSESEYSKSFEVTTAETLATLPSVILPAWSREKPLLDIEAPDSRKGLGLIWPPESQVPVMGEPANGVGRAPIMAAICKMHAEGLDDEWKSYLTSSVKWKPNGGSQIKLDSAKLVARAVKGYIKKPSFAMSIPDGFTEGAQQALVEAFESSGLDNFHLIPRPISISLKWCQEHSQYTKGVGDVAVEGKSLGYLLTVSMGMDLWEIKFIEIRVYLSKEEKWLVPVDDPATPAVSLGICGASLCKDMLEDIPPEKIWYALHGTEWMEECRSAKHESHYSYTSLKNTLSSSAGGLFLESLDIMQGLKELHESRNDLRARIADSIRKQMKELKICDSDILATVSAGTFSDLSLGDCSITDFLLSTRKIKAMPAEYISQGAALACCAINNGLPSYRTKLIPVDIYTVARSSTGDKEEKWVPLIAGETVEAGWAYEPDEPIAGLSIPASSASLDLTLRRPSGDDYLYRMVKAHLSEETTQKEGVEIYVSVKPGQGFSKVTVDSSVPGVFSTVLDWKGMVETDEPKEPFLEYIPNVSYIETNKTMFEAAEDDLIRLRSHLELSSQPRDTVLRYARERVNKWPKAVASNYYKKLEFEDLFKHKGVLNSDGATDNLFDSALVLEIVDKMETKFKRWPSDSLLRLGAWFYRLIPESMLEHTLKHFNEGDIRAVHLHTAGLCFHKPAELKCFFKAFAFQCKTYPYSLSEWFRALRNIVRFKNHALSFDVVSTDELDVILNQLILTFAEEVLYNKYHNTLNNCLQASMFILKRRRYDEDFLSEDDVRKEELDKLLQKVSQEHQNQGYRAYAEAALKFLHKQATAQDASKVLEST